MTKQTDAAIKYPKGATVYIVVEVGTEKFCDVFFSYEAASRYLKGTGRTKYIIQEIFAS